MPDPQPLTAIKATRSPLQLALQRAWSKRGLRVSCYLVGLLFLLGVYAPFLANDDALIWWDETGLSFPLIADLFNYWSYPQRHDLLFNLAALLLPVWVAAWFLLRRWLGAARRLQIFGALTLLAWVFCQLPLFAPLQDGGERRAIWDRHQQSRLTYATWQRNQELASEGVAAARNGDVLVTSDGEVVSVLYRSGEDALMTRRYGALPKDAPKVAHSFDELRVVEQTMTLFPLVPHEYSEPYQGGGLKGPMATNEVTGSRYLIGSDVIGRDLFALMLFGARISLTVGILATTISMVIGIFIGAISGYFGGWVDIVLQRVVEIVMTFPGFILVLVVVSIVGRNIFIIIAVFGLVGWAGTARLVRGEFLTQAGQEYVLACQALGLPRWRIMFRHILPNAMTPLLIGASFSVAGAVLGEAGLAFLGLVESTTPSWGLILNSGRDKIEYPHLIYAPGIAIFILVYSLNTIGNGLREALDVRASA